jgi:hypothetical protein
MDNYLLIDTKAILTIDDKEKFERRITLLNTKLELQNEAVYRHEASNQNLTTKNSDLDQEMNKKNLEYSKSQKNMKINMLSKSNLVLISSY